MCPAGEGTWEAERSTRAPSPPPMSGQSLRGSGSVLAASSPSSAGEIVMLSHLRTGARRLSTRLNIYQAEIVMQRRPDEHRSQAAHVDRLSLRVP